jgi:hypothetical protein
MLAVPVSLVGKHHGEQKKDKERGHPGSHANRGYHALQSKMVHVGIQNHDIVMDGDQ